MKITNHGISNAAATGAPPDASTPPGTTGESAVAATGGDAYRPSPEWLRTLDLVKQQPEVRADRVQAALARLARGDYASARSIEQTADAILNSLD